MPRTPHPLAVLAVAVLLAGCTAGCAAGARASAPTWVPAPTFQGEGQQPTAIPNGQGPAAPSGPSTTAPPSSSGANADDPAVVATKLTTPDAIAILPDGSALVGERTTGRILQVQPKPHQPVRTVRTLTGLNSTGGGGLLDLALSPNYAQDNLVFAYLSTATDNRVVDFTLTGAVTPVLTGIPRGPNDNVGRITFGTDGRLYVGTGDAGQPSLAPDRTSLAGKVLRVTDIGRPASDNPLASSPVFTSGQHSFAGLCLDSASGLLFEVEPLGVDGHADINVVQAGADYGWPRAGASSKRPMGVVPAGYGTPGGCAVEAGALYVTSLDGAALLAAPLTVQGTLATIGAFVPYLKNRYGRLLTVIAAPDGALWLTTSNRDGHGRPTADDERVLRISPPASGANYPG